MDLNKLKELYNERKLSTSELKKREEIAQAIAKEHPEMEMSKKMAIATAQAKKSVDEEIESIEEVSKYDAVVTYYRSLGLDPYKLRGKTGSVLRTRIKNSPAFHAWAKINHYESVDYSSKFSSALQTIKEAKKESLSKKIDVKFYGYPDANNCPSDSDKNTAKTDDNFLTPN